MDIPSLVFNIAVVAAGAACFLLVCGCRVAPPTLTDPFVEKANAATLTITESIPANLPFVASFSTFSCWADLIGSAQHTLDICAYYMELLPSTTDNANVTGTQGEQIYRMLEEAIARGIDVRIVINPEDQSHSHVEANALASLGAKVRSVAFAPGIQHSKFLIVDNRSAYVGSANFDWRALEGVKELGVCVKEEPEVALDLDRIFSQLWQAGGQEEHVWTHEQETTMNMAYPGEILVNGNVAKLYIGVSPPELLTLSRTWDLLSIVDALERGACPSIEVMEYGPAIVYAEPTRYFGTVDNAIRAAGFRGCTRLLVSFWKYMDFSLFRYIRSLSEAPGVEVRVIEIPNMYDGLDPPVEYVGVSHAKFVVSDDVALVSTSNFIGDYWTSTIGVTMSIEERTLVQELRDIYERDWNSEYTISFTEFMAVHPEVFE